MRQYICPVCNKQIRDRTNLKRHCKVMHAVTLEDAIQAKRPTGVLRRGEDTRPVTRSYSRMKSSSTTESAVVNNTESSVKPRSVTLTPLPHPVAKSIVVNKLGSSANPRPTSSPTLTPLLDSASDLTLVSKRGSSVETGVERALVGVSTSHQSSTVWEAGQPEMMNESGPVPPSTVGIELEEPRLDEEIDLDLGIDINMEMEIDEDGFPRPCLDFFEFKLDPSVYCREYVGLAYCHCTWL